MHKQAIFGESPASSVSGTQEIPIDILLRNFFVDWLPAGHSVQLPLVEALAHAAKQEPKRTSAVHKKIYKPYERRFDQRTAGIVTGETTSKTRAVARILIPYSQFPPKIPEAMVGPVVGLLEKLDAIQVADAKKELRSTSVGQILQDFAFTTEPPLASRVNLSPDLTPRISKLGKINQKPQVIWRGKDGIDYCDRKIRAWRLAEGYAHVFSDRPRCPLSWSVAPLLEGYPSISIRELALVCLRQQVWLEAMADRREALRCCEEMQDIAILPPTRRATPLPRDPSLPHPDMAEMPFRHWSIAFGKTIAVHFEAKGAGPCEVVRQEWAKNLAGDRRFLPFHFAVEDCVKSAISLGIRAVPTIMLYKAGKRIFRGEGARGSREISDIATSQSLVSPE